MDNLLSACKLSISYTVQLHLKKRMKTSLVFRKSFFYTFSVIILTSAFSGFLFTKVYHNNIIASIALLILLGCIVGIIFFGKIMIKKFAVRSLQIKIDESSICFIKNHANKPHIIQISFEEILWYSMAIINPRFYELNFRLRSGKKISFSFPQEQSEPENNDSLEVLEKINSKIGEFNKQNVSNLIELKPAFSATYAGKVLLVVLILLTIFTFILVYSSFKSSFLGLFAAVSAITQFYIRRTNNIDFFNKMHKVNQ